MITGVGDSAVCRSDIPSPVNEECGCFLTNLVYKVITNLVYKVMASVGSFFCEIISSRITSWMYNGYRVLPPELSSERTQELITTKGAYPIECYNEENALVEMLCIPPPLSVRTGNTVVRTDNVVVLCLNTTYQDHHPRHWEALSDVGVGVILFNPTSPNPLQYAKDLEAVLRKLRERNPQQKIVVKSYCASTDPAICAVAKMKDPNTHLIVDRGHGNVRGLARSFTVLSLLPCIDRILEERFDAKGIEEINRVAGEILFLTSPVDEVMDYPRGNLTMDLYLQVPDATLYPIPSGGHWSDWSAETWEEVIRFLQRVGVVETQNFTISKDEYPDPGPRTCFSQHGLPLLMKSWC